MRVRDAWILLGLMFLVACSTSPLPPVQPCNLTLIAIPEGVLMTEDDPLPPNSRVLATPGDFDLTGTKFEADQMGPMVILRLRGDAIDRFAAHTAAHTGDLIAIVLNGDIVSVPMIAAAINDGEVAISSPTSNGDAFVSQFSGCAR